MVLSGSNDVTPMMQKEEVEPLEDTPEVEPPKSTRRIDNIRKLLLNK